MPLFSLDLISTRPTGSCPVQAVASGVLDIAHSDVTEFPVAGVFLPTDTSVFDSLRSAVLSNNKLSTLPREFELCTALQVCTPLQWTHHVTRFCRDATAIVDAAGNILSCHVGCVVCSP
jgi:hypothetical protein